MNKHEAQLAFYMFCYLGLIIGSFTAMFLPFFLNEVTLEILLGVESIGFFGFIGIFIIIASFILYCFQIWTEGSIFRSLGFYLGLSGSIESSVFGIFGFYYFYRALRYYNIILFGAIVLGLCCIASIVFVGLIYIKMGTIEDEKIDDEIVYID
ncbi:MAG: hypothetical protein ACTSPY_12900 [Candidatus Helarchaeota archaeon]